MLSRQVPTASTGTLRIRPYASEEALLTYAREELGCAGVTPVWLSCYVDGCRQELHADVPHGRAVQVDGFKTGVESAYGFSA